jgi:predicted lipoprotein
MRFLSTRVVALAALSAISLTAACGSSGDAADVTREATLASLADNVFVPGYRDAATAAEAFSTAASELEAGPSAARLEAVRSAWRDLRLAWSATLAYGFGPAEDRRTMSLVDWSPVEPERIDQAIERRGGSVAAEDVRELLASSQRGLWAVEYVLFSDDGESLTDGSPGAAARLRFVVANAEAMAAEMRSVATGWTEQTEDGAAYRSVLTGAAPASLFVNAAVTEVVRGPAFLLQDVADMRLAPAIGLRGGDAGLSGMPGLLSGTSARDIRSRLAGARSVYFGANKEPGLSDLVRQLSESADRRMRTAFDNAIADAEAITLPMDRAVTETPADVQALFDSVKIVQQVYNTEVVSLLGVSLGFSDNDGDSAD